METLSDTVDGLCKRIDWAIAEIDRLQRELTALKFENLELQLERDNLRKFLGMVTSQGEPQ